MQDGRITGASDEIKDFLREMSSTLQEANKKIESHLETIGAKMEAMDKRMGRIEAAVGILPDDIKEDDDAEDRKRMKERLKEALSNNTKPKLKSEEGEMNFLEYLFGICKPDGRIGKHGSRSCKLAYINRSFFSNLRRFNMNCRLIHPQSKFVQG
jgi:hypothetical protein